MTIVKKRINCFLQIYFTNKIKIHYNWHSIQPTSLSIFPHFIPTTRSTDLHPLQFYHFLFSSLSLYPNDSWSLSLFPLSFSFFTSSLQSLSPLFIYFSVFTDSSDAWLVSPNHPIYDSIWLETWNRPCKNIYT